jgi:hypothetical protein
MFDKIRYFIPLAFVITAISGLIYLTGQQNLRQNANDPQIQISEDVANRLTRSTTIPTVPASSAIDIAKSLNTFIIIFDEQGKPVSSNALLDGKVPTIPTSVFDYVRSHNQTRITWQPRQDARSAVVITKFDGKSKGFVLVGRSLRQVEEREEDLAKIIGLGWIVTILGGTITQIAFSPQNKKKK